MRSWLTISNSGIKSPLGSSRDKSHQKRDARKANDSNGSPPEPI